MSATLQKSYDAYMRAASLLVCLLGSLWCPSVIATTLEEFGNQMSYFYLAPSQDSFNRFQKDTDQFREKLEGSGNGADLLVAVMIAKISQTHHWPISDNAFGRKAKEIAEGKSPLAKYVIDDSIVDPRKLDIWWTEFFATGDEHYLENIFHFAGLELPKGDIKKMMVVGSATWSFKANCRQHKRILEFARQKLNTPSVSEAQVRFVKECVVFAETNTPERIAQGNAPKAVTPDPAQSQQGYWRDVDGKPVNETESMKSKSDFGGSLLATTDEDWAQKWNTPPEAKPNFKLAGVVPYGKKVFILIFFSNPSKDKLGNANIRCDIKLIAPTGKVSLTNNDVTCFSGRISGNPYNLFLSAPVIGFTGDPGDPSGTWIVEVNLRDAVRNVELPLRTSFDLK